MLGGANADRSAVMRTEPLRVLDNQVEKFGSLRSDLRRISRQFSGDLTDDPGVGPERHGQS